MIKYFSSVNWKVVAGGFGGNVLVAQFVSKRCPERFSESEYQNIENIYST